MATTTGTLTHRYSIIGTNRADVQISKNRYNDSFILATGANNGAVLVQDSAQTDGWGLIPSVAAGQVFTSAGAGSIPSWSATPTVTSLTTAFGNAFAPAIAIGTGGGWFANSGSSLDATIGGAAFLNITAAAVRHGADVALAWSSGSTGTAALDIYQRRTGTKALAFDADGAGGALTTFKVFGAITTDTALIVGAIPATAGAVRLTNGSDIKWRNAANSADVSFAQLGSSNEFYVAFGSADVQLSNGSPVIKWGGRTSSFPAIKRSGSILQARLADDSASAAFSSDNFYGQNAAIVTSYLTVDGQVGMTAFSHTHATPDIVNFYTANALRGAINAGGAWRMHAYGAGAATFDASGNITSVSDARYKEQVRDYCYGLAAVRQLRPVLYRWNELSKLDRENDYAGFIAQEVEAVLGASSVGRNQEGYLSLQERAIVAATVKAVQELADRMDRSGL